LTKIESREAGIVGKGGEEDTLDSTVRGIIEILEVKPI
jgi:hypothetical protein